MRSSRRPARRAPQQIDRDRAHQRQPPGRSASAKRALTIWMNCTSRDDGGTPDRGQILLQPRQAPRSPATAAIHLDFARPQTSATDAACDSPSPGMAAPPPPSALGAREHVASGEQLAAQNPESPRSAAPLSSGGRPALRLHPAGRDGQASPHGKAHAQTGISHHTLTQRSRCVTPLPGNGAAFRAIHRAGSVLCRA